MTILSGEALAGRAVVVTGAARGIGAGIVQAILTAGGKVALIDLDADAARATAAEFDPEGGRTLALAGDVTNPVTLAAAVAAAGKKLGPLSGWVNNAGIVQMIPATEFSPEKWDREFAVNVAGVMNGAQAAYPWLRASAPGSCLLNTASAAALYGFSGQSIYGATKAGVRSLTETLDAEWAPDGIKVRSLMPSFIDTPLLQHAPNASRNVPIRERVVSAGLEFTPVEVVADAAWDAVHGGKIHTVVGKTARALRFAARWMPGKLRKRAQLLADAAED